jgi:hypothetical protein
MNTPTSRKPKEVLRRALLATSVCTLFALNNVATAQTVATVGSAPGVTCTYYAKFFWNTGGCATFGGNGNSAEIAIPSGQSVSYTLPANRTLIKLELRRQIGLANPVTWNCVLGGNGTWSVTQQNGSCLGGPPALQFTKQVGTFNFRINP